MSERFDNFKKSLRHIFTPKNILRGSAIVGIVVSELGCDVQPTKDPEKSTKIDYSAQILDGGISDQFKNEIANTNETMIGSFRVNVVDNDPKSSDVKEEFAVIQNPSGAIAVAHNDNDNTPKVLGYIEPIGQNQILLVDPDSLLPVFIFPNDENQKAEFYPFAVGVGVDKLPGYDGSPIEIEMGTPDGLKIHAMLARPHPSLTPTPYSTPTPKPTATEAPKLPEVNLDLNGDGVTDYVGRIKESQTIEIPEGEPARFELIKIGSVSEHGLVLTSTSRGYITGYDIVTISNGSREIDLTFLRVKYFRKNRPPVMVEFSFLKSFADKDSFKGEASLGKQVDIELNTPSGPDFTERARRSLKDDLDILDLEFGIRYPAGAQWLHAEEIVQLLKTSETDLDFKFRVDPFHIDFSD